MQSNRNDYRISARGCSFHYLEMVRHGTEQSPDYSEAVAHIEQCASCQSRLEDSATIDIPWWSEAKESWLESELPMAKSTESFSSVAIEIASEMPEDSRVEFETVILSFLDAPSHPELLGRLGRYEVERVIGTGGMGIVLKAHDTELHRVVAIKVLAAHLANSASARKRFAREAQAAAAVLHPNVIPIYNVESDGKIPYLVMKCVSGQSLQAKVDRVGFLPLTDTLRIAKQTAAGLAAAHDQGLVHRDVKPANILLEENVDRVVLSDFGLARAVDDASLTRTGVVAGTPHYMSPEQARGDAIDTRSDQFSLGSVMTFMLTGRPPFRASNAMGVLNRICNEKHRPVDQTNADVPSEVVSLVDKLLEKDPTSRFDSMHAVESEMERLLKALQSGGLSLKKKTDRIPLVAWIMKHLVNPYTIVIGVAALFFVMLISIVMWKSKFHEDGRPIAESIRIRSLAEQLWAERNEDLQFFSEAERIERELISLQVARPFPMGTANEEFDRKVQSIESTVRKFEMQFPR